MESLIDELYQEYMNANIFDACGFFHKKYINLNAQGVNLIDVLDRYISTQSQVWKNYFISNKTENEFVSTIRHIVSMFQDMDQPTKYQISNYLEEDYETEDNIDNFDIESDLFAATPHFIFNLDFETLSEAYKNYGYISEHEFNSLINFISYVKKNNLLNQISEQASWQMMDLEELIFKLCDKIQDKSIINNFNIGNYPIHEEGIFDKIKNNCLTISNIKFENYRPSLTSNKCMKIDFGKLIFCLNLKNFYKTGIMPDKDAHLYSQIFDSDQEDVVDAFKELYSKNFNKESFRNNQSNIIYNPKNYMLEYELVTGKKVELGKELICGFIIANFNTERNIRDCYLLHIDIEDVTNSRSNHEIQLNLIPDGNFDARVQLIRLDNWESEQAHRNVAKKLSTTTHIHLYNELDLLRGKTNGAYDIAFNLEGESTEFNTSLKTFLDILGLDNSIRNEISEKVNQIIIAMNERNNKKKCLIED